MFESTALEGSLDMLPPKTPAHGMKNTTMYVSADVLTRAHSIAKSEKVKSRNKLVGSFLAFAVDLFPVLKPMSKQIEEYAAAERCSYVEAIGQLIEKGLKSKK